MRTFWGILFILISFQNFTFGKATSVFKDIPYVPINSKNFDPNRHILDVYASTIKSNSSEVVIFIHGGKWKLGDKGMFNYVGLNFAEKGFTTVLINYRLSPQVKYEDMAFDCAQAIGWVTSQIEYYGGDKNKIYICGHSSGGHLAALVATNNRFLDSLAIQNTIKGCILIDAFAMDIHNYLSNPNPDDTWMFDIFSNDQQKWMDASPSFYVKNCSIPFVIFLGEKTKNAIYHDAKNFNDLLVSKNIPAKLYVIKNRKHMEMVGQLLDFNNEIYKECINFIRGG